jgi:hypothetical protein
MTYAEFLASTRAKLDIQDDDPAISSALILSELNNSIMTLAARLRKVNHQEMTVRKIIDLDAVDPVTLVKIVTTDEIIPDRILRFGMPIDYVMAKSILYFERDSTYPLEVEITDLRLWDRVVMGEPPSRVVGKEYACHVEYVREQKKYQVLISPVPDGGIFWINYIWYPELMMTAASTSSPFTNQFDNLLVLSAAKSLAPKINDADRFQMIMNELAEISGSIIVDATSSPIGSAW